MRRLRQRQEPNPGRRDGRFESASSTRARAKSIRSSLFAVLLIGAGAASPAVAQEPVAEPGTRAQATLEQGDRVRWTPGAADRWQVGDLFALRADTLYVRTFDDPRLAVPLDRVDSLQVRAIDRGVMGKSIGIGAGLGAAVGIGIGFLGRSISQGDGGGTISTTDAIVFGGLGGALPGAFLGWVIGDTNAVRWIPVLLD